MEQEFRLVAFSMGIIFLVLKMGGVPNKQAFLVLLAGTIFWVITIFIKYLM